MTQTAPKSPRRAAAPRPLLALLLSIYQYSARGCLHLTVFPRRPLSRFAPPDPAISHLAQSRRASHCDDSVARSGIHGFTSPIHLDKLNKNEQMGAFKTARSTTRINSGSTGDNQDDATAVYIANIDRTWSVFGNPHGGYLLAIVLDAACQLQAATSAPDPGHLTCQYLTGAKQGRAEVHLKVSNKRARERWHYSLRAH